MPHTFYAGGHPVSRLADGAHKGFDVHCRVELWSGTAGAEGTVSVKGAWPGAAVVSQPVMLAAGTSAVNLTLSAAQTLQARLWHPNGHGEQVRYGITATFTPAMAVATTAASTSTRKLGFRHVALVTVNDTDAATLAKAATQDGSGQLTMFFRVNGAPMFARGSNKIPMELLDGRMSAAGHRRLVQSAAEANFNMLRIWGGGIFEPRAFYDACDEFGVMNYHDMQFASGEIDTYTPADFAVVKQELQYQVRRLGHHPSIAMWDGCNECGGGGLYASFVMTTVASVDRSRPVWPSCPSNGWDSGVDRLSGRPNGKPLSTRNPNQPPVGRPSGYPFLFETHGPYTAFLGNPWHEGYHQPRPFMMNDTVMALAAETPPQARESCNCAGKDCEGPSACERYATPALTGAGEEGWYRSEFGATSWPSFESVSANLPPEQWGMSTAAGAQRNWNVSNVIYTYFGVNAVVSGMKQSGEAAFKQQLYQSAIGQLLFLKTEIESWRSSNVWGTTYVRVLNFCPCLTDSGRALSSS